MAPQLSVILTTYNRPEELTHTLRSVLDSTVPALEVLVMDDHSGSETFRALSAFNDRRLRYYRQPYNVGLARNRWDGLMRISAPVCCFLTDGDRISGSFLASRRAALDQHPDAWLAYSGATSSTRYPDGTLLEGELLVKAMLEQPHWIGSFVFRRERLLPYFERAQRYGQIWDRAMLLDIALTPSACAVVLDRADSWMSPDQKESIWSQSDAMRMQAVRLIQDRMKSQGPRIQKHLRTHLGQTYASWARHSARTEPFKSFQRLLQSVYYQPGLGRHRADVLARILGLRS
jgi:glycosyltransferase involved in cell wall biosynthesis